MPDIPVITDLSILEEKFATRTAQMDEDLKSLKERFAQIDHILNDKHLGYCRRVDLLEKRIADSRNLQARIEVLERIKTEIETMRESDPAAVVAYLAIILVGMIAGITGTLIAQAIF